MTKMMFKTLDIINYLDWTTINYKLTTDDEIETTSMFIKNELVGYSVIILNYKLETDNIVSFLASFEVKYRNVGYGSLFIKHLSKQKPLVLHAINGSGPFYYINGAYILYDHHSIYEDCAMIIGVNNNKNIYKEPYIRKKCKSCEMLHFKKWPDECIC